MLYVQELVFDVVADRYIARNIHEITASVDATNIADYCHVTYGEPLDVATTVRPDGSDVVIGWTFPLPADLATELSVNNGELVVIPSVATDDGDLRSLFEHLQEQRQMFERLQAQGRIDAVVSVRGDPPAGDIGKVEDEEASR